MSDANLVLVTGATGLVGRRLIPALLAQGFRVRALSRNPERAGLPPETETLEWNGRTVSREALFRTHAVVHLSGEPVFGGRLTEARRHRILDSRVVSTKSIVEEVRELPEGDRPSVFLCASAVGYYGSRGDEVLTEEVPPGTGFLSEVCQAWEAAAAPIEELGIRRVSLRIGVVLAREGGALAAMRMPFKFGVGGRFGSGAQWFPWIHVDDLVSLLIAGLTDDRYSGVVNAVAPNPVTNAELTRQLGQRLNRPTFLTVPEFAARFALGELADELFGSRKVVPQAALDANFEFRYPEFEDALATEL